MTNAEVCKFVGPVTGAPDAGDVGARFTGTWTNEGSLGSDATNDLLSVDVTSGAWAALPSAGTLTIAEDFWNMYGRAVVTLHLGNGSGDPDWFFFELTHNTSTADFSVVRLSGGGGGLGNVSLWGSGQPLGNTEISSPVVTPEPGSLLLLGTGLVLCGARLRRRMRS
jgi:hypothetical protein